MPSEVGAVFPVICCSIFILLLSVLREAEGGCRWPEMGGVDKLGIELGSITEKPLQRSVTETAAFQHFFFFWYVFVYRNSDFQVLAEMAGVRRDMAEQGQGLVVVTAQLWKDVGGGGGHGSSGPNQPHSAPAAQQDSLSLMLGIFMEPCCVPCSVNAAENREPRPCPHGVHVSGPSLSPLSQFIPIQ